MRARGLIITVTMNQQESSTPTKSTQLTKPIEPGKPTYTDRTQRIQAWSQLIKSIAPFIWVAVLLIVIIPLLGRAFIFDAVSGASEKLTPPEIVAPEVVVATPDQQEIDQAIIVALDTARTQAKDFATQELDHWIEQLMSRVDESFLPWYFDYFNQKKMEFSAPFVWLSSKVSGWWNKNSPPPSQAVAEQLTEDLQTEFAKRVLRPKIAQMELERITRETTNLYIEQLRREVSGIQSSYKIPQAQWERYLDDIAVTIIDTEGHISNLSMKVLTGGSTYVLAKAMIPAVTKIGSKVAVSAAGKASAKVAAKTGGVVAGKLGAQFLDPIVAVGIIAWDVWDYHHTVDIERPILRSALADYLWEVRASLLDNHRNSVMAAVYQVEEGIFQSLQP